MSMHKTPLTQTEEYGLSAHGLDIGTPSQLSDAFRQGIAWGIRSAREACENERLGETLGDSDQAYENAITHCVAAIDAL